VAEESQKTLKKMARSVLKFPNTEIKTAMPNSEVEGRIYYTT
jgi:hypothetical protein